MASTEQVLRAFILDYLAKRGFVSAAEGLRADHLQKGENPIGPPAIDVQNSFLLEFFAPFWDVFSARCRRANKRPQQQQPEANLDPSVALQQNLFANRRSPQTFRQLPNNQQQTSQQQQTQQHQLQHQQQHPQHQTSQQQQQQQQHHQHQQRQLLRQQQILQSRNRDRQNFQNQAIHSLSLDSLQKPDLTHNPTQLTNDMIDVNGAFDGFLSTVNTRPQQTRHQQTSARQQLMSQVPRHSTPQQTLPMRQQNKRYQNIPVIGSEAPSSASRRTAMDVQTANQPFDDTVEEDSAPRPQNTQHQKKRPATQTLSRKSPASSPSSALSPPVPFPDAAPAKRQRPSAPFQQPVNSVIHPLQQHHQKLSGVDIEGMSRSFQQAQSVKRNRNAHLLALQQHQQRQQQHAFAQAQQAQGDRQNMPFVSAQLPTQPTQQSQQTGPNPDKMLQRGAVRFPGRTANVSQAFLGQEHMSKRQQEAFHHAQTNGRRQQGQVTGDTAKGPDGKPVGAPFRIGEPGFTMNQGPPGTPTQATQQAAGTTRPSGAGTVPGQPGTGAEKATGALGTPGAPETPGAATTPNAAAQQFGLPPNTFQMPHQGLYMMDGQMRLYQSNPNQLLPNNLIPQNAQVKKGGHESATPSANGKSGNDAGNSKQLEAQMEAQRMFEGAALKDNSANHRRQQSLKAGMPLADHDRRLKDKKSKNGDRSGATKGSQAQSATDRKMATSGAMKTIETSRGGSRRGTATDNAATKAANMRATNSSSPNGLGIATAATGRAGKQSGDVEVDIRSAKSDRQAAASRGGGTPSQKSTASGGSGAGDKRASSGSTGKRTGRARPRPRGTGNQRRTKADRTQQQSRTGSSRGGQSAVARNAAAAAAAEVKAAAAAAAASAAVATGDSARGAQGDASGPDVTTGSLLAPPTRAPGSAQAQSGKADNGGRQAVGRSFKQPEEPKLPFDNAVNGNSDNGHDESGQQHQQQQLLDMLQSGGRSGGEVGLDSMEKPFNIHQMGMVGPAKIGQTGGYGYDIQQYLTPGVGEGNDLENMLSMNSMQDNLGLEGSDFGEENILGVGDPDLGLVGRSRS